MVYIFLCIDFDRDAAFPLNNIKHGVSKPIHSNLKLLEDPEKSVALEGTINGFGPFMNFIIEKKLPLTFYFEARSIEMFYNRFPRHKKLFKHDFLEFGVHGYDHEDLTGEETKLVLSSEEVREILKNAKETIEILFSKKICGFRAPYMRTNSEITQILSDLNFIYDSSRYHVSDGGIQPYFIEPNLVEFPVIKMPKNNTFNGMYTYLWPLFEGKRSLDDVIRNYSMLIKNTSKKTSYISINLHSWHFAYNISQNCYLREEKINRNMQSFKDLISALEKFNDVIFSTPKAWLDKEIKSIL